MKQIIGHLKTEQCENKTEKTIWKSTSYEFASLNWMNDNVGMNEWAVKLFIHKHMSMLVVL